MERSPHGSASLTSMITWERKRLQAWFSLSKAALNQTCDSFHSHTCTGEQLFCLFDYILLIPGSRKICQSWPFHLYLCLWLLLVYNMQETKQHTGKNYFSISLFFFILHFDNIAVLTISPERQVLKHLKCPSLSPMLWNASLPVTLISQESIMPCCKNVTVWSTTTEGALLESCGKTSNSMASKPAVHRTGIFHCQHLRCCFQWLSGWELQFFYYFF